MIHICLYCANINICIYYIGLKKYKYSTQGVLNDKYYSYLFDMQVFIPSIIKKSPINETNIDLNQH
jgi:hypothetical protein